VAQMGRTANRGLLGGRSTRTKGARGRSVAWHTEAKEEKGKGGSAQRVGKDKREGGGPVALHRVEEESVGWPVRHLPHEAGERVAHVGYA
jgi:hypothetical protein